VRRRIEGTPERPRLAVFRSSKHVSAQIIDDLAGRTLLAASTIEPALRSKIGYGGNKAAATALRNSSSIMCAMAWPPTSPRA